MENRLTYPSIAYPNPANIPTPARNTAGHAIRTMGMATIASANPPTEHMLAMRADDADRTRGLMRRHMRNAQFASHSRQSS